MIESFGNESCGSCWTSEVQAEGVVERGEMLRDVDDPFCHQMVLQFSPRELGP